MRLRGRSQILVPALLLLLSVASGAEATFPLGFFHVCRDCYLRIFVNKKWNLPLSPGVAGPGGQQRAGTRRRGSVLLRLGRKETPEDEWDGGDVNRGLERRLKLFRRLNDTHACASHLQGRYITNG